MQKKAKFVFFLLWNSIWLMLVQCNKYTLTFYWNKREQKKISNTDFWFFFTWNILENFSRWRLISAIWTAADLACWNLFLKKYFPLDISLSIVHLFIALFSGFLLSNNFVYKSENLLQLEQDNKQFLPKREKLDQQNSLKYFLLFFTKKQIILQKNKLSNKNLQPKKFLLSLTIN